MPSDQQSQAPALAESQTSTSRDDLTDIDFIASATILDEFVRGLRGYDSPTVRKHISSVHELVRISSQMNRERNRQAMLDQLT